MSKSSDQICMQPACKAAVCGLLKPEIIYKRVLQRGTLFATDLAVLRGYKNIYTVFNLIAEHTPISAQSSNFRDLKLQPLYFNHFFIKSYVVGTHLNYLN